MWPVRDQMDSFRFDVMSQEPSLETQSRKIRPVLANPRSGHRLDNVTVQPKFDQSRGAELGIGLIGGQVATVFQGPAGYIDDGVRSLLEFIRRNAKRIIRQPALNHQQPVGNGVVQRQKGMKRAEHEREPRGCSKQQYQPASPGRQKARAPAQQTPKLFLRRSILRRQSTGTLNRGRASILSAWRRLAGGRTSLPRFSGGARPGTDRLARGRDWFRWGTVQEEGV